MIYEEALSYIHSLLKFGIHPGLERMDTLLKELGEPHKELKYVHVAGTNGKGSVSTAISNILTEAGYKTGLYTSPYVTDFLERIQYNGKPFEKNIFVHAVQKVKSAVDKLNENGIVITEFEALTASAFLCFKELECDIVVLEVGLGGRLDATNVIDTPVVNVITSLSLDHTAILGDTLEKIAFEKCGTIKENGTVVLSANQYDEAYKTVKQITLERNNTLVVPDISEVKVIKESVFGTNFSYKNQEYFVSMPGKHQIINMTSVIEASRILTEKGYNISIDNIKSGIKKTVLPARCEVVSKEPLVILDGGHNEDGAKAFYNMISGEISGNKRLFVIAGMLADKDVENSLKPLIKLCKHFIAVTPKNPRAMESEELCRIARKYCEDVKNIPDVCDAIRYIKNEIGNNDVLCVVGSLYLAGEARQTLFELFKNKE